MNVKSISFLNKCLLYRRLTAFSGGYTPNVSATPINSNDQGHYFSLTPNPYEILMAEMPSGYQHWNWLYGGPIAQFVSCRTTWESTRTGHLQVPEMLYSETIND